MIAGILALLIAEVFIGFSIVAKNATLAGLVEISYPIFIALFSYLLFKQQITLATAIGATIICHSRLLRCRTKCQVLSPASVTIVLPIHNKLMIEYRHNIMEEVAIR